MNAHAVRFHGEVLMARGSGTLWWPSRGVLVVSDLHLGKSGRIARRGGTLLPPYELDDTLLRLEAEIAATDPAHVICLGDSFDDLVCAETLRDGDAMWIARLMAGRDWVWIAGNHDPAPMTIGGTHLAELVVDGLTFRHIAQPGAVAEISGHYHPKARLAGRGGAVTRACFLADDARIVMPAFGTYTGGLFCDEPALARLMRPHALAILTGPRPLVIPMPRPAQRSAMRM